MRILHLFHNPDDHDAPPRLAMLCAALGRLDFITEDLWFLGPSSLRQIAHELGVRSGRSIGMPMNTALLGLPAVRYHLNKADHEYDLLHCWSPGSFALAIALRPRTPRMLTLTQGLPPAQLHALRLMLSDDRAPAVVTVISQTLQHQLLSAGIPEDKVHVLRPGLDLGMVAHGDRHTLRKQWGIEPRNNFDDSTPAKLSNKPVVASADKNETSRVKHLVIGLLTGPLAQVDARMLMLIVGLTEEALRSQGYQLHILIHPRQRHHPRAQLSNEQVRRHDQFIIEPRLDRPWEVLPGCDLALALGPGAGGLSLLWGMAGNVPIVGEATYTQCELLEDHHSALLAQPDQPIQLARRLTQLATDSTLAWKLRDTARNEAFRYFSRVNHCQGLQKVYEQMVTGQAVAIPAPAGNGNPQFESLMPTP